MFGCHGKENPVSSLKNNLYGSPNSPNDYNSDKGAYGYESELGIAISCCSRAGRTPMDGFSLIVFQTPHHKGAAQRNSHKLEMKKTLSNPLSQSSRSLLACFASLRGPGVPRRDDVVLDGPHEHAPAREGGQHRPWRGK